MKNVFLTVLALLCLNSTVFSQITLPAYQEFRARYNYDAGSSTQPSGDLSESTTDGIASYNENNFVLAADFDVDFGNRPDGRTSGQVIEIFEIDEVGDIVDQNSVLIDGSINEFDIPVGEYKKIVRIIKIDTDVEADQGYVVLYNFTRPSTDARRFGIMKFDSDLDLVWHKPCDFSSIKNISVSGDDFQMRGLQLLDVPEDDKVAVLFELDNGTKPKLGIFEIDPSNGSYINTELIQIMGTQYSIQIFGEYTADFIKDELTKKRYTIACTAVSSTVNGGTTTYHKEACLIRVNPTSHTSTTRIIKTPLINDVEISSLIKLEIKYLVPNKTLTNFYLAGTAIDNPNSSKGLIMEIPVDIFSTPTLTSNYKTFANANTERAGFHEIKWSVGVSGTGPGVAVYAIGRMYDDALNMRSFMGGMQEGNNNIAWSNNTIFDQTFTAEYELSEDDMYGQHAARNQNALSQICVGRVSNTNNALISDLHIQKTGVRPWTVASSFEITDCDDNVIGNETDEPLTMDIYITADNKLQDHTATQPELSIEEGVIPFVRLTKCFNDVPSYTYPTPPTGDHPTCTGHGGGPAPFEDPTSIDPTELVNIQVYPTSTDGLVQIETENEISKVLVYGMTGALVYESTNTNGTKHTIDLSDLENGTYMVTVFTNNEQHVSKIMKF